MGESPKTFNLVFRLLGVQLILIIISVLFMESFAGLISSTSGLKIYSSVTAFIYLCAYYSKVWKAADKDRKIVKIHNEHHDVRINLNMFKGLYAGLLAALPNICLLTVVAVTDATKSDSYTVANTVLRILLSHFVGWLGDDNLTYIPNCVIVIIIPIVLGLVAYIAGTKNFSVTERYLPVLVYKKNDDKKRKKQKV